MISSLSLCSRCRSDTTVKVPSRISPGQTIRVLHPDGSGRQFEVLVPSNVPAGNTFYVQIGRETSHCQYLNEEPVHAMVESRIGDCSNADNVISTAPNAQDPPPFSQCLDKSPPTSFNKLSEFSRIDNTQQGPSYTTQSSRFHDSNNSNRKSIEKRLLVRVPIGAKAGMTLHVKIPDEPGRMLSAQVPIGNVKEFYVTYEPGPRFSSQFT